MQDTRAAADGTLDAFRKEIGKAEGRYRRERLAAVSGRIAWTVAVALFVLLLLSLVSPLVAWAVPLALGFLGLGLIAAWVTYRSPLDRHRLLVRMDAHAKLPDSILSTGDWENATDDPWRKSQRAVTLRQIAQINWRSVWPVYWPRLLWLPLAASLVVTLAIWQVQSAWSQRQWQGQLAEREASKPVAPERLKPLEQVFADWDKAQEIAPSPELKELMEQLKPLRDQMASGEMTEKQLFLKLNEVQARLQAAKDKLESSSMEPMAQSLADAVKDLDSMSGLAAALQRKDFAAAREQAAKAQEKYQSGQAKMPEGAKAQAAASRLGEASQKAQNDAQTASSLQQMQNGLSKKDSSSMSKGLGGLKESLGKQSDKQSQCRNLGMQLSQLGEAKNGMGNGNGGIKMGLPQLSLAKSMQEQKGAGTDTDPNRAGAATQLDSTHQDMKITGTAGDGASQTQVESTLDPHQEQTPGSISAAQFANFQKLSEQAAQDENLPVADRQMIKRYFEDIRPQSTP